MPFSANRQMAAASAAVGREHDTIHMLTEVDITEPRRLIREHRERTGEQLSLTAYIVTCLARAVAGQHEGDGRRVAGKQVRNPAVQTGCNCAGCMLTVQNQSDSATA